MNKKHYVDLSDIKENDLDNTASFTDLMSRSEKLEHKRKKEEEQTRELKEILMNEDDKKKEKKLQKKQAKGKNKNIKNDTKKEDNHTNDNDLENLNKTQKFLELTNEIKTSMLKNVDDNLESKKKRGIGNILVIDLLIVISLAYYIYSILFTNIQTNQLYLLIGGCFILGMIFLFCISLISNRTFYKIFSVLNYLVFLSYILFNLILVLGIIKL